MSNDPDYDNSREERARDEYDRRVRKDQLTVAAFDWFAQFVRRINSAQNFQDLKEVERRVGLMPGLVLPLDRQPEISF